MCEVSKIYLDDLNFRKKCINENRLFTFAKNLNNNQLKESQPNKSNLKIGILIKEFKALRNWELRIIKGVLEDDNLELSLLIKDGRKSHSGLKNKIVTAFKSKNVLGFVLFGLQTKIESKLFKIKSKIDRDKILKTLLEIPFVELKPQRKGFLDIFSQNDSDLIKSHNLDIILRHEFGIIQGEILTAAKNGIWSFHHGDNSINRGSPAGFWELYLKQPVIGVTLQKLTSELDGGIVIDKGFYNRHWAYYKNRLIVQEGSVDILFKNIKKLRSNKLELKKSSIYYNPLYKIPSTVITLKYIKSFYGKLLEKQIKYINWKLLNKRYECWTLFLGKGNIFESTLYKVKQIPLPKKEFWADPFIFKYKGEDYVFFENYCYKQGKGKISCGRLKGNKLEDIQDIFDFEYHLSYPFIFEEDNEIYLIPESSEAKELAIYKNIEFPNKWEKFSTGFEGETVIDATYYKDRSGVRWLFINRGYYENASSLYIYRIDSLALNKIESHSMNPVIIDSRIGRGAGPIFEYNDMIIRPSQNNSNGIYGYGLNLNVIKKLTIDEYEEENLITIEPNYKKGLMATHHIHQVDEMYIIDGAYKKK